MDERTGLWSRRGFKAQCLQIIVLITTALGFLNSSGSAAQESPIVLFGIEAVERALSSFDKDLKFAALASVQRGLVRDVVTAQVLFVDAAKGHGPIILLSSAFAVRPDAELTKSDCLQVNREIQRWILGGSWRKIPENDMSAVDDGERTAEAVKKRELPVDVQVRGLIRRFRGYAYDPAEDLALSPQEIGAMRQKYVSVYNSLSFRVTLLRGGITAAGESASVACSNHDNND